MLLLLFFIFSKISLAEVLQYDVTNSTKREYTLEKACELSGAKHLLLVSAIDASTVDCMGKKLNVKEFCLKEQGGTNDLVRGFLTSDKVICQHGKSVVLSVKCDGDYQNRCEPSQSGCDYFKALFAYQLEISHSSFFKDEKKLNCYFAFKLNM